MAYNELFIDVVGNQPVGGLNNPSQAALPTFYQGDTLNFRIYLLKRTQTYNLRSPHFEVQNLASLSLKVGVGVKNGTAGSTLYTQQFTWAKDAANQYFFASIPLNTAAINTLLGSAAQANAWIEFETTEAGFPTTVFQKEITIQAEVVDSSSVVVVPPGATAMTAEEANATFLKQTIQGQIYLVSPDGTKTVALYVDNDGTFHSDPVT